MGLQAVGSGQWAVGSGGTEAEGRMELPEARSTRGTHLVPRRLRQAAIKDGHFQVKHQAREQGLELPEQLPDVGDGLQLLGDEPGVQLPALDKVS